VDGKGAILAPARLRLEAPWRLRGRPLAVTLLVVGGLIVAYVLARQTSLFAVRAVEVIGAPPTVVRDVERVAVSVRGRSLVALDRGALQRQLLALPSVVAVRLDRAFPSRLEIQVVPEHPAAVVRAGRRAWLVSRRGRVVGAVGVGAFPKLPRLWLASRTHLTSGTTINRDEQALALEALVLVPAGFPAKVSTARDETGDIVFVLGDGLELRLGSRDELRLKLRIAERILATLSTQERSSIDYLDVGTPERVVAGVKAQVEGSA
jgi:cell division septal protein FtsQ